MPHDRPARGRNSFAAAGLLVLLGSGLGVGCGPEDRLAEVPPAVRPAGAYDAEGHALKPVGAGPRPNLLIVVLPELRADRCGTAVKGSTQSLLPRLEALADEGDAFGHAVTPTPEPSGALASLLTGLAPVRHRVSHVDPVPRLAPGFVTLGEILRVAGGYATRAFVAEERLARATSLWQGFEVEPGVGLPEAPDALTRWMRSVPTGTPHAAVLVTDTLGPGYGRSRPAPPGANPVDPRRAARAFLRGAPATAAVPPSMREPVDPPPTPPEQYDRGLAWVDGLLGALFDRLEAEGLASNTLIVVTSTSGTALGERGALGAGTELYDEQVRIPLVFGGSVFLTGEAAASKTASLMDVLPTLLDLLGLPLPEGLDGVPLQRVLLGEQRRGPVTSEEQQDGANTADPAAKAVLVAVRSLSWKYIVRFDLRQGTVVEQAFDLSADPGESRDLARDGALVGLSFDDAFCEVVERVRDGIWGAVKGANRLAPEAYGQGARVVSGRPAPCR